LATSDTKPGILPNILNWGVDQTLTNNNGIYTYVQYNPSGKERLKLNFIKSRDGVYMYDKSSLHVPKPEDLYAKDEILAGVKNVISSFRANKTQSLKQSDITNDWATSTVSIKDFNTGIYENDSFIKFSASARIPLLDNRWNSEHVELAYLSKILEDELAITPKKVHSSLVKELVNEHEFLTDDGIKINLAISDEVVLNISQYKPRAFNETSVSDALKKIIAALKNDVAAVRGDKNGDTYDAKINPDKFEGTISETTKYYNYRGYPNYLVDNYTKDFLRLVTILQNSFNKEPIFDNSLGTIYVFILEDALVEIGKNSRSSNMWIEVKVSKAK